MNAPILLQASGIVKRFGGFVALEGVDLDIRPGERLGLIGPNGSGKSTLVNCIAGALLADEGSIIFDNEDVTRFAPHARARRGIARSFQIPRPLTSMTVAQNLHVPLRYARRPPLSAAELADAANEILRSVGLLHKSAHPARGLTQVELRKLELARAIAMQPRLLVADEALAGLSGSEIEEILALLLGLKEHGVAVLMIEHIMHAMMKFSERIVVLMAGRKIADGDPRQVVQMSAVVKAYLGE
ncbi:ABC transporter ATP-binding protein [Pigmentiphaga sp. NML080357]|uniref:ABC transporter ATP-binding protein n=1 Tax=Pigmentiphaga sp. NML080357 TaxID=2008675 RepID=UPI000B4172CF|nr:ABC transporter ATP-binding protein [Pigmentiphaga sp. NML080357]OVZ57498.1 ABC transporter ATP-binding protein [Pigmentiphaga sp. NML080357]